MILVEKLGKKYVNGWVAHWAKFRCPYCHTIVIKQLSHGRRQKSCGCLLAETHPLRRKGRRYMSSIHKAFEKQEFKNKEKGAFTLYLGHDIISKLAVMAQSQETSVSTLVRQAIKLFIEMKEKNVDRELKDYIGYIGDER